MIYIIYLTLGIIVWAIVETYINILFKNKK